MTIKADDAIKLIVQHFLLDDEKPLDDVTDALAAIGGSKSFEALGHDMFAAMIRTHMARMASTRAKLAARSPIRRIH